MCCRSLRSWYVEFVILCSYSFFVMFANIIFALSYFVSSLFVIKPNVHLMFFVVGGDGGDDEGECAVIVCYCVLFYCFCLSNYLLFMISS